MTTSWSAILKDPLGALVGAALDPWLPSIRVLVGDAQFVLEDRDRTVILPAVIYLKGPIVAGVGAAPTTGDWTDRIELLGGPAPNKELVAKVLSHAIVQLCQRSTMIRPVMRFRFRDGPPSETQRTDWIEIGAHVKARRVEFD